MTAPTPLSSRIFSPLNLLACVAVVGPILSRASDPVIPQIALSLSVLPATAALLSTAYTLPFALAQPVLGPLSDVFGRARIMFVCLSILVATTFVCSIVMSFPQLMSARIIGGIAGGGLMPIMLALVSDRFALAERRVAISRVLGGAMIGNLVGAMMSGFIGDLFGWRGVFIAGGFLGVFAVVALAAVVRSDPPQPAKQLNVRGILDNFRAIFADRRAKYCFGAVYVEGLCLFGLFPFVALILHDAGETKASIAGIVLGAYGVGSLGYSFLIGRMMTILSEKQIMIGGASAIAVAFCIISLGLGWPTMMGAMFIAGLSFFMVHGWIQIHVSEILPDARGAAISLHAFFLFLGSASGPVVYGFAFSHFGVMPTMIASAALFLVMGLVTAAALSRYPIVTAK